MLSVKSSSSTTKSLVAAFCSTRSAFDSVLSENVVVAPVVIRASPLADAVLSVAVEGVEDAPSKRSV